MNLNKAIKVLMESEDSLKIILKFAKEKYNEKFPDFPKEGWRGFNHFKIINENTLEISYRYGYGDVEYESCFRVDLIKEFRDNKIKEIIK